MISLALTLAGCVVDTAGDAECVERSVAVDQDCDFGDDAVLRSCERLDDGRWSCQCADSGGGERFLVSQGGRCCELEGVAEGGCGG